MPNWLAISIDVFYVVISIQASYFSWRLISALRGGEISISWWFICSGMILFFAGSIFQLYMDIIEAPVPLALQALFAPAISLFLIGIYLEHRFWQLR
ncbi:MAG: hypothetical protein HYU39_05060 [Thaumarchaeota archaeon]|nr:hypothetical protein [Nitrososphaerota archaeon]